MQNRQGTIREKTTITGKGLHTGRMVRLEICPAPVNTGIVFRRSDSDFSKSLIAHPFNVSATQLSTTLGEGSSLIGTVEHLMAALFGAGIDNAYVYVNAPEIPIMDGSSGPFFEIFRSVGIERQSADRRQFIVKKPFEFRDGEKFVRVEPYEGLVYECVIDFDDKVIGKQAMTFAFSPKNFAQIATARTFCHARDVEMMRTHGLALGGSLDNAVVIGDDGIINQEGLRFENEFVRHKLLDCVGDLALMGGQFVGKITTYRSGHGLHARFMQSILSQRSEYLTIVEPAEFNVAAHNRDEKAVPLTALYG